MFNLFHTLPAGGGGACFYLELDINCHTLLLNHIFHDLSRLKPRFARNNIAAGGLTAPYIIFHTYCHPAFGGEKCPLRSAVHYGSSFFIGFER